MTKDDIKEFQVRLNKLKNPEGYRDLPLVDAIQKLFELVQELDEKLEGIAAAIGEGGCK